MAVTQSIKVSELIGLPSIPMLKGLEGASQTFERGAPIVRGASSSAGYLVTGAANMAAGTIVGVAQRNGKNTTRGQSLEFVPPLPGVVFEAQVHHASAASAVIAQTDRYSSFGLQVDASTLNWYINKADTSAPEVTIIDFIDAVGTLNGRVKFVFKSNYTIFSRT